MLTSYSYHESRWPGRSEEIVDEQTHEVCASLDTGESTWQYKRPIDRRRWLMPAPSETLKFINHRRGACEKQDLVGSSVSVIT